MKVHTDTIGLLDIRYALQDAQREASNVWIDHDAYTFTRNGRKRKMTHNVLLIGEGARHTRRRNSGGFGAKTDDFAATWMDWGWFIAVMFRYEPTAVIGQYDGREDFLDQTRRAISRKLHRGPGGDPSVKSFAMRYAAAWPNPYADTWRGPDGVTSPFELVDRVCPPTHLITLRPLSALEAWLEAS